MTTSAPGRPTTRRWVALAAAVGGLLMIGCSFLPWITAQTVDGGTTSISGWGSITGSSEIAGTNLNDVLDGGGSYRPGAVGLILGALTLIVAVVIASVQGGPRPHRITAAVLALAGLFAAGWGLWRAIAPGDAGVFDQGEASAGAGPWLTALGGAVLIGSAALIFAGVIDPPAKTAGRGIQPR